MMEIVKGNKNVVTITTCELTGRQTVKWTDKNGYIHQSKLGGKNG